MLQTLLMIVHSKVWSDWLIVVISTIYFGYTFSPFSFKFGSTPKSSSLVATSFINLFWFPALADGITRAIGSSWVDSDIGFILWLVWFQWWLKGIYFICIAAAEPYLNSLGPPPKEPPDRRAYRKIEVHRFSRHHRKVGVYTTVSINDGLHIPFFQLFFECWKYIACCFAIGLLDLWWRWGNALFSSDGTLDDTLSAEVESMLDSNRHPDFTVEKDFQTSYHAAYDVATSSAVDQDNACKCPAVETVRYVCNCRGHSHPLQSSSSSCHSNSRSGRWCANNLVTRATMYPITFGCMGRDGTRFVAITLAHCMDATAPFATYLHLLTLVVYHLNPFSSYLNPLQQTITFDEAFMICEIWLSVRSFIFILCGHLFRCSLLTQGYFRSLRHRLITAQPNEWSNWILFRPFYNNIVPFYQPYLDYVTLFKYSVLAPQYEQDVDDVSDWSTDGLTWRTRRHIRRANAKAIKRGLYKSPQDVEQPRPPPEPPPLRHCYWISSIPLSVEPWYRFEHLPHTLLPAHPPVFDSDFYDVISDYLTISWEQRIDDFVSTFDPSAIVASLFLGTIPLHSTQDAHDRKITIPVTRESILRLGYFHRFYALYHGLENNHVYRGATSDKTPLIIDTGASVCISPHRSDFITYKKSKLKIRDLSASNSVAGEGYVRWTVRDKSGALVHLELPAYHMPKAEVRLLSPQVLLTLAGGESRQTASGVHICLGSGIELAAPICPRSNLPILAFHCHTDSAPRSFWSDAFAFTATDVSQSVLDDSNVNLSAAQKETLLWHHRLSHASISWIKLLMRDRKWLKDHYDETSLHQGPFIPCKHPRSSVCDTSSLKCTACLCAKAHVRSPAATKPITSANDTKFVERINSGEKNKKKLKRSHTHRGDCVSADHYMSGVPGRLPHTYGRERHGYTCGTLFVDHASCKIFNFCQLSTSAVETISNKHKLETMAKHEGFKIKSYHSDNGTFASAAFKQDCDQQGQKYTFSGVGAHHQNGVAERNIQTVACWARASMIHAAMRWPAKAAVKYWPMAISYAVWVFNRLPQVDTGVTPNEIWSESRSSHEDFRRAHVFGCPVYVLDPKLQDGHKIPKWDPRARLGMFLGYSDVHSSLVPLVLNVRTGKISPQYHVIFDDEFATVHSTNEIPFGKQWTQILKLTKELYLDVEYTSGGKIDNSFYPPLDDEWITDEMTAENVLDETINLPFVDADNDIGRQLSPNSPPLDTTDLTSNDATSHASVDVDTASGGADAASGGADPPSIAGGDPPDDDTDDEVIAIDDDIEVVHPSGRPRRNVGTWKDGPARNRNFPIDGEEWVYHMNAMSPYDQPFPLVANRSRTSSYCPSKYHCDEKVSKIFLSQKSIMTDDWDDAVNSSLVADYITVDPLDPTLVDEFEPRVLAARVAANAKKKSNADSPTWEEVMAGEHQQEFWSAMEQELHTLSQEFKSWSYVRKEPGMNILPSTWAFKIKRYPDGLISKFKARFCARGDLQKEGIDYFDTWAPVVQWATVRTIMVLAAKLQLISTQCDITAAFLHAELPPGEEVYVHQPRGFKRYGSDYVLKLHRTLYGLKQSPRYFYDHLSTRLQRQGLTPSKFDPCLFLSKTVIVVVYVDDILLYSRNEDDIDDLITRMREKEDVILRREGTAEGFLGVDIKRDGDKFILTQPGLTKRIIEALGLSSKYSTALHTPAACAPLARDKDGEPISGTINYASVIGMLLYLAGHSRPDIAFAVHQCARYTFDPKRSHEVALKHIGRYLKGTMDKGLIMSPSDGFSLDCFPDADFAGLYGHEDSQDPHCVRSRTGYCILFCNCPILWVSKLQPEIALSTMESEYIALSTSCRDLFPIIDIITEISGYLDFKFASGSNMHVRIHEDNVGALTLGKLEPRRMTLRSKHYAVKYHWFREQIKPRNITLVKIDTKDQLGDIFTKGLGKTIFECLRKKLMGW